MPVANYHAGSLLWRCGDLQRCLSCTLQRVIAPSCPLTPGCPTAVQTEPRVIDGVLTRGERELWDKIHPDPYIGARRLFAAQQSGTNMQAPASAFHGCRWGDMATGANEARLLILLQEAVLFGAVPYRPGGTLYQRNPPHPPV